ncbi:MAG TPA: hypothetical protein VK492_00360 [Chitinophagaceae bacterium]|nr:hypothetical protein [Chitinophagaceae bacterium]
MRVGGGIDDSFLIYPTLVKAGYLKKYILDRNWDITPGSEGKPSIISSMIKGKWTSKYYTFSEKEFEPFIFTKHFSFHGGHDRYVDISEDFIHYFKLYEKVKDKQSRTYSFIDESGDLDEVIRITPNKVLLKKKYLLEYISVRKIHFAICFDFMRIHVGNLSALDIQPIDKDFQNPLANYNHYVRDLQDEGGKIQSWIHGKLIIPYDPKKSQSFHFSSDNYQYESFLTGYDENGNEVYESCKKENERLFTMTYFKKSVLDKYYNDPAQYQVDGWSVMSKFFTLKIDNNIEDYVPVFLVDLSSLPHKEQLHWKQFNIPPQVGMSYTYYQTMIEGNWVENSESPDLFFKEKYIEFNKKWKDKFGWELYKTISKEDEHYFTALHIPTSNNVKSFCEQILSIVKLTIDRLNEKELSKSITVASGDKGITKFENFLKSKRINIPDMIAFLRHLQSLRSGLIAHSFSSSNIECKKAMDYFEIGKKGYKEIAKEIFIKSIFTLNTLEKVLLK